jgi:hypothetical protein
MNVKIRLFGRSTLIETTVPVSSTQEIFKPKNPSVYISSAPSGRGEVSFHCVDFLMWGGTDLVDLALPNLHRFQAETHRITLPSAQGRAGRFGSGC